MSRSSSFIATCHHAEANGSASASKTPLGGKTVSLAWFAAAIVSSVGAQTLVADINRQPAGSSSPYGMTACNGKVVFAANDGVNGYEPWISDGTSAGTMILADLYPGAPSSSPSGFIEVGGRVVFTAIDPTHGRELWSTDGTTLGTSLVLDIRGGSDSSNIGPMLSFHGRVYFAASESAHGNELWTSDGTTVGTYLVKDIRPGVTDGNPWSLVAMGDAFYFVAPIGYDRGQIWRSDGTTAGTTLLVDLAPMWIWQLGPTSQPLVATEQRLFCLASDPVTSATFAVTSDGSPAGTRVVDLSAVSVTPVGAFGFATAGDVMVFTGYDPTHFIEPWRSDGTVAGTYLMRDINPAPSGIGIIGAFFTAASFAFFVGDDGQTGYELWRTDGTRGGTILLADLVTGAMGANPSAIARIGDGNVVLFGITETDGSTTVCVSDGTPAGTRRVTAHGMFTAPAPSAFALVGDRVYFAATTNRTGTELWSMPAGPLGVARSLSYGAGCPGTGISVPELGSNAPLLGSPSFALRVRSARPNAPMALLLAAAPASATLGGGCTLLVPPDALALPTATSATGTANLGIPIPNVPGLVGGELFAQGAVADPLGAFFGVLCFSGGRRIVVGY